MNAFQMMVQLIPLIEKGIELICAEQGTTPEQAVNALASHLTPGKPNAPALSETAPVKQ